MTDVETNAETSMATAARLSSTNMQGIDQLISVSQECINSALTARYSSSLKRAVDTRLRNFKHAIYNQGEINATLGAPHVQLSVPGDDQSVYFYLNFASGTFKWHGAWPNSVLHTQSIAGWSLAFKTTFNLKKLPAIPQDVVDKITLLNEGSYSISQLLLSLSAVAAASIDWGASATPGLDQNDENNEALKQMESVMEKYLHFLSSGPYSVLGYAIQVQNPSVNAIVATPTFPPTAVQCRIQQYQPLTDAFKTKNPRFGDLDYLVYEQMTQNNSFPAVAYDSAKSGNWIVGGSVASLTISRKLFFDSYIAPNFENLNIKANEVAANMLSWYHRNDPANFVLSENSWWSNRPLSTSWSKNPDGTGFTYVNNNPFDNSERLDLNSSMIKISQDIVVHLGVTNTLVYNVGQNSIKFDVKIEMKHASGKDTNNTMAQWSGTIEFADIKDGVLDVVPKLDEVKITSNDDHQPVGGIEGFLLDENGAYSSSIQTKYQNDALATLKTGIPGIDTLQSDILNIFTQQSKFVFSGAQDYDIKNFQFNATGDLIVDLSVIEKEIAIEDTFNLQINDPDLFTKYNGYWVSVSSQQNIIVVALVQDKKDATLFRINNGDLAVDVNGKPDGFHATAQQVPNTGSTDPNNKLQDLIFITKDDFDKQADAAANAAAAAAAVGLSGSTSDPPQALDFSTTGGDFDFCMNENMIWLRYFTLFLDDHGQYSGLRFYTGGNDDTANTPYKIFALSAIY